MPTGNSKTRRVCFVDVLAFPKPTAYGMTGDHKEHSRSHRVAVPGSGKEDEMLYVSGSQGVEVTMVDRSDLRDA